MISILITEPYEEFPEWDVYIWSSLGWPLDKAIPVGRLLGEWAWVGRVYK